jgi:hypothetical protein
MACGTSPTSDESLETSEPTHFDGGSATSLYALQTFVYQPDDTVTSYVALTESLDIDGALSLSRAREFPGYAFITVVGGKLLLSSGEEPTISQFEIDEDSNWTERAKLSFLSQGVPAYGAGFERHWFLDEHTAYLTLEVTGRIVWDPTRFEIVEVLNDTSLKSERDDLVLDATFNRPPRLLKGPVLKPFYYRDEDWYLFGPNTSIAVYDPDTHEESAVVDVPCPALEVMSQDEQGNTYFSPWTYGPALGLFGEGPDTCIRRLKSDSTLDEDWAPDFRDWTDGRPVQVLRYVGDGKALATVLHLEEVDGDFGSGYDETLAYELDSHWRLWLFDLENESARPVAGIGATGSGFNMERLDDRTFVFVPDEDWSSTTIYELEADGSAIERFSVGGVVNSWLKVR